MINIETIGYIMPRISLWSPTKGNDFNFTDRTVGENLQISGDCILVHLYAGPTVDSDGNMETSVTSIQDVLFLENRDRKYSPDVIELRGHHEQQTASFDLSQFGLMLNNDTKTIKFHYNSMVDRIGRKLMSGDVLELPSMRDVPIFDNAVGINRYYVIQDSMWDTASYGQKWLPHIWSVRAKLLTASPEYSEITKQAAYGQTDGGGGQGVGIFSEGFAESVDENGNPGFGKNTNITDTLSMFCSLINITDKNLMEAEKNAFFDPKFFESANLYIYIDENTKYPVLGPAWCSGDGAPPNISTNFKDDLIPSGPLAGVGIAFPETMKEGEYYLRIDYSPDRLFQKQGNKYKLIEINILKVWSGMNVVLDSFINNVNVMILPDGSSVPENTPVSKIIKQKVDLYAERKSDIKSAYNGRTKIADSRARAK